MSTPGPTPFRPRALGGGIRVRRISTPVTPGGKPIRYDASVQVPADPGRVWLLICCADRAGEALAVPAEQTSDGGISMEPTRSDILIHAASLPTLVGQGWMVYYMNAYPVSVLSGSTSDFPEG